MSPRSDPGGPLADALLFVDATRCRMARGHADNPLPGIGILDAEVERLLAEVGDRRSSRAAHRDRPDEEDLERVAARARQSFAQWLAKPSLLSAIATRAALSPREAEVLGFLVAVELDEQRQKLLAYIQQDMTKLRPTLATIRRVLGREAVLGLGVDGALRRSALVSVDETTTWAAQVATLAPAVTWAMVGDDSLDPDLPPSARVLDVDVDPDGHDLVLVVGPDETRRLQAAAVRTAGSRFLVTPVPDDRAGWEAVVREATVGDTSVVLGIDGELSDVARWWIERTPHLAWALSSPNELPLEQVPRRAWTEVRAGEPATSADDWSSALGDGVDHHGHRLSANQLRLVTESMPGLAGDLDATVRRLASGPLDKLARRIRPRRSWDDLILSAERKAQLEELCVRYRHRDVVYNDWGFPTFPSIGLVSLFAGPSGTGKTLAAEVIAHDLGLDLFKMDLSTVVSKYIGETEKNLEQLFSAASGGNLVLFFDEADAVFGKRAEVSDARDRYANLEVSYLLQRLEAYDGLVILATNFQKNIDEAFMRRIHVGIEFALPEQPERERIWRHAFPPGAPTKDVDFAFLAAQFRISGGNIAGAALHAAFLAAEAGEPITMEPIMLALKREFQKLGRLRTEADFGPYTELVNGR